MALALIPLAAFLLLWRLEYRRLACLRTGFVTAAIEWACAAVAFTELLSLPHWLTRGGLVAAWTLCCIVAAWLTPRASGSRGVRKLDRWPPLPLLAGGAACAAIIGMVGIAALIYPPNITDAMVYHSARVVFWLQNAGVSNFPSHEPFEMMQIGPGAEYLVMQFRALSGGDRLDNLVQGFAMLGCGVAASLIARSLGAAASGQLFAALFSLTIPQGILQASGVKNDYVLAFFLSAMVLLGLRARHGSAREALAGGAAMGLACLTKSTALLFAPPLVLVCVLTWRGIGWRRLLGNAGIAVAIASAINAGFCARALVLHRPPFGPTVAEDVCEFRNASVSLPVLASNLIRNACLQLGTPIPGLNSAIGNGAKRIIAALGADPNDPGTTWCGTEFAIHTSNLHEIYTANPLHLALILVAVAAATVRRRRYGGSEVLALFAALAAGLVLFCAILRWQPWHTRLHLPLFVLAAGPAACVLTRFLGERGTQVCGAILFAAALPFAGANQIRPLTRAWAALKQDRAHLYFTDRSGLAGQHIAAVDFLRATGCRKIGIDSALGHFQYPVLALLEAGRTTQVRPVTVANDTAMIAQPEPFEPCAVLCLDCAQAEEKWRRYRSFPRVTLFDETAVFAASGAIATGDSGCGLSFGRGWHTAERSGAQWWRWSDRRGEIEVRLQRKSVLEMRGELMSLVPQNRILLNIDGEPAGKFDLVRGSLMFSRNLDKSAGPHRIEFISREPGLQPAGDNRILAFGIRNLAISTPDGSMVCH